MRMVANCCKMDTADVVEQMDVGAVVATEVAMQGVAAVALDTMGLVLPMGNLPVSFMAMLVLLINITVKRLSPGNIVLAHIFKKKKNLGGNPN